MKKVFFGANVDEFNQISISYQLKLLNWVIKAGQLLGGLALLHYLFLTGIFFYSPKRKGNPKMLFLFIDFDDHECAWEEDFFAAAANKGSQSIIYGHEQFDGHSDELRNCFACEALLNETLLRRVVG